MRDPQTARVLVRELLALEDPASYRPTSVERTARSDRGAVNWEHIAVVGSDGDTIPCLLLTPHEPAGQNVIALHQHAGSYSLGKSEPAGLAGDSSLGYGLRLAQRGARVLIPDLLGFEDRYRGWSSDPGEDERRDARDRIAHGSSLQAKYTRDVATLTTWLVDSHGNERGTGVIGHSLGGQVALFSLAFDPRLTVGVVSCGLGTLASFEVHALRHNPAWFVPGLAATGDVQVLAAALHEQRILVSAGITDPLFPLQGVRDVVASFRPGVCTAELFEGGHELPPSIMDLALNYLADAR